MQLFIMVLSYRTMFVCMSACPLRTDLQFRKGMHAYTPCLKKLCKIVFVRIRTSSNFHQFWQFL